MTGLQPRNRGRNVIAREQEHIRRKVQRGVEERIQPNHPAEADQPAKRRMQPPQRRNRQIRQQQPKRPIAGEVGDAVHRIGIERQRSVAIQREQIGERRKASRCSRSFRAGIRRVGMSWFVV